MTVPLSPIINWEFLKLLENSVFLKLKSIEKKLEDVFTLTTIEKELKTPSGRNLLFSNRVHWAKYHLKKLQYIEEKDGGLKITLEGKRILELDLKKIHRNKILNRK